MPAPSHEDVTTFSAVERGLGVRLIWPIVTLDSARAFVWQGPGPLAYGEWIVPLDVPMQEAWINELLRLSR